MESVLTVRLENEVKEQGVAVMRRCGFTPSEAVRRLFDYAVKNDALPFDRHERPSKDDIRRRIAAFDAFHTKTPSGMSDEAIREGRLKERYGSGA